MASNCATNCVICPWGAANAGTTIRACSPTSPARRVLARTALDSSVFPIAAERQTIAGAIVASLRKRNVFRERDVSLTLPMGDGKTLVVSVRTENARMEHLSAATPRGLDARQLRLVMDTIHEKLGESLTVSLLSSVAGLSCTRFSQLFRTTVGLPPHAHIVGLRIERAMKLMLDTDVPLSEIALAVGFSDQAHFSNKFRRAAGVSPAQWRRAHQS